VPLDPIMDLLRAVPLFADFPDEPLRLVAFGAERINRRRGQRLFTESAPAFTGYLVIEGAVELRQGPGRDAPPVAVAKPGDLIGELALLCEMVRPATAVMREDGVLLEIPRLVMRRVLEEYPSVAKLLRDSYANRLGAITSDLQKVRDALTAFDSDDTKR
jgi:CRP-like cAMP-binding protein